MPVVVGQHHVVGDGDEQGAKLELGLAALLGGRAPADGDNGGGGTPPAEAGEQREAVVLAAGERREGAAVLFGDVGGHGGLGVEGAGRGNGAAGSLGTHQTRPPGATRALLAEGIRDRRRGDRRGSQGYDLEGDGRDVGWRRIGRSAVREATGGAALRASGGSRERGRNRAVAAGTSGTGRQCMNKSEIVGRVAWRMGLSKARAEHALDTVLAAIGEALAKDEEVRIAGFGRFVTRSRAARTGRNPRSGERVAIPASRMPSFKAGKVLRVLVNGVGEAKAGDAAGTAGTGWEAMAVSALARERDIEAEDPAETELKTDLSKWPGGVAPVWTLLEPESVEGAAGGAVGGEPHAPPRGRPPGGSGPRVGVRAKRAEHA